MTHNYTGLSASQVEASRKEHGENILTPPARESLLKRFLQTLTGPFGHFIKGCEDGDMLVFILEMAAVLSLAISLSEYHGWLGLPVSPDGAKVFFEPAGIILAIILASGVGFLAEVKAEREFEVLNQVNDDEPVTVIRDSHALSIPKREVVVGDILVLTTGEEIPADAEILEATRLSVDESTLTGEPITTKNASSHHQSSTTKDTYPPNHLFRGTKIMEGHAMAEVFAVGDNTENGKVFTASKIEDGKKTPLNEQFDRLGILITTISCIVGVLVLIGRIVIYLHSNTSFAEGGWERAFSSGDGWGEAIAYLLQSIMIAVTLVVCAVPEGLPMAVTMALAYSMRRMLKTNNLVRKMHATETMGATTVICTDKTGTLTMNQMRIADTFYNPEDLPLLHLNMAVNSTAMLDIPSSSTPSDPLYKEEGRDGASVLGNPTEGALLLWLHDKGIDYRHLREAVVKTDEQPFTTETKYMSTTLVDGTILLKGAPEVIISMCDDFHIDKAEAEAKLREWQSKAMRTLAFAIINHSNTIEPQNRKTAEPQNRKTLIGICAIMDPVRPDVPPAIQSCLSAGIKVKIVTGDAPETAREIYRQIFGHYPENVVFGSADTEALAKADIIARARPMDKRRLVEALQKLGEVVTVTGDGTNDAPALKTADVGLSMGDGTSVAKEASDITIIDNSFSSIVKAVMWGRSLYINIQRFILFQLTVNITACLVVMIGSFMTPDPPLTVTQMLWVNLIMDTFAAVALASLPPSEAVMKNKPRNRKTNIIDRQMAIDLIGTGIYFTALMLTLLWFFGRMNGTEKAVFFTTFILLQFWNLFAAKRFKSAEPLLAGIRVSAVRAVAANTGMEKPRYWLNKLRSEKSFWFIAAIIFCGQILIITVAYNFFNIAPLDPEMICMIIIATAMAVAFSSVVKLLNR